MNATRFLSIPDTDLDRIIFQVAQFRGMPDENGCIQWTGQKDRYGYGRITLRNLGDRKKIETGAHRVIWVIENGEIPDSGLVIDHLCRNRACVNARHLELVSNTTNLRRGALLVENRSSLGLPTRRQNKIRRSGEYDATGAKITCSNGHDWVPDNIYRRVTKAGYVSTSCKPCARERLVKWKAKQSMSA